MEANVEEKYKATKLWNDAIRAFRTQMPVKTHRKHFKSYAESFTGTEAVDWLHGFLSARSMGGGGLLNSGQNLLFGSVKRDQTLALLNKFYEHGLFELCRAKANEKSNFFDWRVKDDGTLYRFANISPSKIARTPLAVKNSRSQIQTYQIVKTPVELLPSAFEENNPSTENVSPKKIARLSRCGNSVTPLSYRKIPDADVPINPNTGENLRCASIDNLLSMDHNKFEVQTQETPAFSVRQGSLRSRNHKPIQEQQQQNLPELKIVARQLSSEEIDNVWKTIAVNKLQQILRCENIVNDVSFIHGKNICHNAKYFTARGVTRVFSNLDDLPSSTIQAMKCLANWPWQNGTLNLSCYPGFERDVFATILDFFAAQPTPLIPCELQELMLAILNRVEYLDVQQWDANQSDLVRLSPLQRLDDKAANDETEVSVETETEFGPRSPVTRLKEKEPRSRSSYACSRGGTQQNDRLAFLRSEFETNVRSLEEVLSTLPGLVTSPRLLGVLRDLKTGAPKPNHGLETENAHSVARFATDYACAKSITALDVYKTPNLEKIHVNLQPGAFSMPGARFSVASTWADTCDISETADAQMHLTSAPSISFFTKNGRQIACEALQLCLLFLPPKNRRWFQLLLRMMSKIGINHCLRLDKHNAMSNRSIVLDAFCDVIMTGNREAFVAASSATGTREHRLKLLSFLLDSLNDVFAPPRLLTSMVECRITEMQKAKVRYGGGSNPGLNNEGIAYCTQISTTEYQKQGLNSSRRALEKLLDSIADDTSINPSEKRKRLKKFKSAYPDLFYQRFPTKSSFETLISNQANAGSGTENVFLRPLTRLMTLKL